MATIVLTQRAHSIHRHGSLSITSVEDRADGEQLSGTNPSQRDLESSILAWLSVLGAFTFTIPSYGKSHQDYSYLHLNQLKEYSTSDIGWISGIYLFLSYFFNMQIDPMCDRYGPVTIGSIGVLLTVASFVLLAECNTYWQFMVFLGVVGALGGATISTVGMTVVAKLFVRRRGLAMGITFTGSSVGSILFSLMLQSTLPKYGWQWSMRLMGLVIAGLAIPGLFCFWPTQRLSPSVPIRTQGRSRAAVIDFSAFRSYPFSLVSMGQFVLEFAIFAIAGLLPTIAVGAGFAPEDGFTLVAILGACSCFGRIIPGLLGDMIGHFNTILLMTALTLIFMGSLFVPFASTSLTVLYVFSGLWGFSFGSFLSVSAGKCLDYSLVLKSDRVPSMLGQDMRGPELRTILRQENLSAAGAVILSDFYILGTSTFFVSFSILLSIPLGGLMMDNLGSKHLAGILTSIVFLGGICYIAARGLIIGRWSSFKTKV